ncbi:hypothetical protein B0A49_02997 [Cryomyces minteri]|uniref:VPS9 domain-containing protein n=1 Tax=Cryomyces minteri TaxID=331657 RepID=A0A4U0XQ25_9PEZI|nr:hypothetical protein B0A49_02997 [Cryomyces minteri]
MQPLNPFLRAFFRSTLPTQCSPVYHHILLVPTTEVLLCARDQETHALYADLAGSEDFLASHVLRIPGGVVPSSSGKDNGNVRENKGKAKQYSTLNGRTVVVKDAFIYSNKGFRALNQAQILSDALFYPDVLDAQQWLVYYISKPLVGSYEVIRITPAIVPADDRPRDKGPTPSALITNGSGAGNGSEAASSLPRKKEIKSFSDLLNHFPMIARQMQPGLERLFKEFTTVSQEDLGSSLHTTLSNGSITQPLGLELRDEEDKMRRSLETAVTAAIDLFQMVDKQQLSLLGATTELTGPLVERMIERYITEQVHDSVLFSRICAVRRVDDLELESRIKQMLDVDISQVGIPIEGGQQGKQELAVRLARGAEVFKKMGVAGSPQEMLEILLATEKSITMAEPSVGAATKPGVTGVGNVISEKPSAVLTINADTLISMLLVVVIRSPVRHLQARLSYMRHFIFIDDVESGEMGYALNTFDAVLAYLARDSGGLRRASRRNRKLWQATKTGNVPEMRAVLEPDRLFANEEALVEEPEEMRNLQTTSDEEDDRDSMLSCYPDGTTLDGESVKDAMTDRFAQIDDSSQGGSLAHIFPFQRPPTPPPDEQKPKMKKRVAMMLSRSTSNSSSYSARSRSRTKSIDSHGSGIEGDTSIVRLSQTQGSAGDSVMMMAIESYQQDALRYLLGLHEYYPINVVLEDCNNEGTTLLSAAVQLGHSGLVDLMLDFVLQHAESREVILAYLARPDSKGRCVAHYMFNQPRLISKIGKMLPWRRKDKNGQTPLFALCRSYDHAEYHGMVDAALSAAADTQGDNEPLHLDDHVDGKGNTLLHIVNDPQLTLRLLHQCDSDVNSANDKRFTPLMVASKYGRTDLVRVFFADSRVDLLAKDIRGLTAVELAKDDEVRNRFDDLVLLSSTPGPDGRTTTIVRSFFVEDATIRLILKSGAPNAKSTITVTTCRRSVADFENLARWLALEHPASWIYPNTSFTSPFLIPSKPSRAALRDVQVRLDNALQSLLTHPTFSTHEMVWEFFLVPDIDPMLLGERSRKKAETRVDKVKEEYAPVTDMRDVEVFVAHAKESVRGIQHAIKSVLRRVNKQRALLLDLSEAQFLASNVLSTLAYLPKSHTTAFERYSKCLVQAESSPMTQFYYSFHLISVTTSAVLTALNRPGLLIGSMQQTQKSIDRHLSSMNRQTRWPSGLFDDTRRHMQLEAAEKAGKAAGELETLGCELRYTQQTVAAELAGWQDGHEKVARQAIRQLARKTIVAEKARLQSMRRALRELRKG